MVVGILAGAPRIASGVLVPARLVDQEWGSVVWADGKCYPTFDIEVEYREAAPSIAGKPNAVPQETRAGEGSVNINLCPDHRDKQQGRPCLACLLETAERKREAAEASLRRIAEWAKETRSDYAMAALVEISNIASLRAALSAKPKE